MTYLPVKNVIVIMNINTFIYHLEIIFSIININKNKLRGPNLQ